MKNKQEEILKRLVKKYKSDPVKFAKDVVNFIPETYQEEVFNSIKDNNKISVKSGAGVGKTGTIAVIILWYLFTHKNAKIIATSPSMTQLYAVLWKELGKWYQGTLMEHLFTHTKTTMYLNDNPNSHFALAKTSSTVEGMSGFHEENLLIIVDEASGVKEDIMEALLGTMSHDKNKIVLISNPTKTDGTFYDTFNKLKDDWVNITINAEESNRVSDKNIATLLKKFGSRDSRAYKVRVLGEFPEGSESAIIPRALIESNIDNVIPKFKDTIIYGFDVAKGIGGDNTVIYKDNGSSPHLFLNTNTKGMMDCIGILMNDIRNYSEDTNIVLMIDEDGIGAGTVDRINEIIYEQGINNIEVYGCHNGSKKVFMPRYYSTQVGEMFYTLKELLENKAINVENRYELIEELSTREIAFSSDGKITAERKELQKKRLGRSPDLGDAFLLCIYGRQYI